MPKNNVNEGHKEMREYTHPCKGREGIEKLGGGGGVERERKEGELTIISSKRKLSLKCFTRKQWYNNLLNIKLTHYL